MSVSVFHGVFHGVIFHGVPGKMTRRVAGAVIGSQGLAVFFGALVARALAAAEGSSTASTFLLIGSFLALLCILDAGLLRRPWGVTLGWVLQISTVACAFIVPLMLPVGLLFGALWVTALVQGRRMDDHTERVDAQWRAAQETSTPKTSTSGTSTSGTSTSGTSISQASSSPTSASQTPASQTPASETSTPEGPGADG